MSWSITVEDLDQIDPAPPHELEQKFSKLAEDNPEYENDAYQAFALARECGLVAATLSGGRTPSPYGGPDSVVIAVTGFSSRAEGHAVPKSRVDFYAQTRDNIFAGPDDEELWTEEPPGYGTH